MSLGILLVVAATAFIQSLFGVGVLLFGTPLLLVQGYDFVTVVSVLLPVSLMINSIQIIKDFESADKVFYKKILLYAIPFVVIFIFVATSFNINIGLIVGLFIMFIAAREYLPPVDKAIRILIRYENAYLVIMGIIHGLTNLGGSLLTALVHSKGYQKNTTRTTIAMSYATFAIFQILTLLVFGKITLASLSGKGIYLITGIVVFLLAERFVYKELDSKKYSKYFAIFLMFSGIIVLVKSL